MRDAVVSKPDAERDSSRRGIQDLAVIETILRNRYHFFQEIRDGIGLNDKMRAMLISTVLFLATTAICAPTLYFFNVLFGSNQSLTQNVALMLTAITVTAVLLLSFAPIVVFFLLTTAGYQFFKLLNVTIFAVCGIVGVIFLAQGMRIVSSAGKEGASARRWVLWLWVLVYAFVGSQMAWTLRPFIGAPSMKFELFRQLGGNFYTNVFASIGEILGFFVVR